MTAPFYETQGVTLFHGDCIDVMRELPDESVHAVVTDPPYGIAFMGKQWDQPGEFGSGRNGSDGHHAGITSGSPGSVASTNLRPASMAAGTYDLSPTAMHNFQRWCEAWARECFRVLKPGGHLLSFGGSRTWHRLAAGIEDAGFEMRDSIAWLYGSGFPKSMDVSKAIDATLLRGGSSSRKLREAEQAGDGETYTMTGKNNGIMGATVTVERKTWAPETEQAKAWQGWGTALKPAFEPIVVARKPLAGTVAANVLEHGVGALNIDATRIATDDDLNGGAYAATGGRSESASLRAGSGMNVPGATTGKEFEQPAGRWPTNVVLDESQAAALDEQAPDTGGSGRASGPTLRGATAAGAAFGARNGLAEDREPAFYGDRGGASRFFPTFRYEAKAPTAERPKHGEVMHPTVKPLDLMQWLVRLVTPKGGTVLEPFAGSGTTVEACIREGFDVIAIEREADYLPLIEKRVRKDHAQGLDFDWGGVA